MSAPGGAAGGAWTPHHKEGRIAPVMEKEHDRPAEPGSSPRAAAPRGMPNFEKYAWLFMRFSGVALVFLALGHLFIMLIWDGGVYRIDFNYVAQRWASPFWQIWDMAAAVAGHDARRQRHAHDHRRLRPQEHHEVLSELAAVAGDRIHAGAGQLRAGHLRREHLVRGELQMIVEHRYDVVIVGAGGAGMRAAVEAGPRARTAVLTKLYPTRSHTGAAQGGMCAALANVEEDNWEWHTFDTVKGGDYLADQDAVEIMCKEAIDAVLDLEKMGMPFNRTPEGRIDQRRFGGHTRDHGKAPVRRACYAADRTGHMILQTLYQNCVKHDVEFFNEFYALDIAITETPVGSGRHRRHRLRAGDRRHPRLPRQGDRVRHRRFGPDVQDHLQRAHPDRRRAWASSSARDFRWRTWSFTSSTRPVWPAWAS